MRLSIGFTGTRRGMNRFQLHALARLLASETNQVYRLIHGACIGSDTEAHDIAKVLQLTIHAWPGIAGGLAMDPIRLHDCAVVHERRDYLERNRRIVDDCDLLVGAPRNSEPIHQTRAGGTWYTLRYARRVDKPAIILFPDGTIQQNHAPKLSPERPLVQQGPASG